MASPLLSVVMPVYNNEPFVEAAVRSVLDQTDSTTEIVIADHESSDGTWKKLQQFESTPGVRLLRTPRGGGPERNFNRVSREATGKYLKLVCGDDILLPGVLARQVGLLEGDPTAALTAGPRQIIDSSGRVLIKKRGLAGISAPVSGPDAIRATVRAGSNIFGEPGSVTMRREYLEAVGFWDFTFPYLVDQATYVRVLTLGGFLPDTEVGAAFRLNKGQTSVLLGKSQAAEVQAFHSRFAEERPDILTPRDVSIGDRRARGMATKRRLAYRILATRMR